jgi:nucleotide-binding universal stress UspA family protein
MKTRLLVPTDGSALSLRIVPTIEQFLPPDQAELILLRVSPHAQSQGTAQAALLQDPLLRHATMARMTSSDFERGEHPIYADQIESNRRVELESELQPIVEELQQHGYAVEPLVKFGDPAEAILMAAQQHHVDLIAMSTHGRTGLKRQIFGSVTEDVLRHTDLPILVIHPQAEQDDKVTR